MVHALRQSQTRRSRKPMTEPRQATPRDLWAAVDTLLNPTRTQLTRDGRADSWFTLPPLWEQLLEATDSLTGRAAAGARSRPPCSTRALSLQVEIEGKVRWACRVAHIKRTFELPRDLRQLVSAINRENDTTNIEAWHAQIHRWAGRIRNILDPRRAARLHGAACRVCSSTTVLAWDDAGEETRQPALAIHSEDGMIQALECGYCGSTLTGDDLTGILLDVLKRAAQLPNATEALQ
jgi:hypothetical protein